MTLTFNMYVLISYISMLRLVSICFCYQKLKKLKIKYIYLLIYFVFSA